MADQNLKQIQFKRTSTENKAPGADIVARGEIALNTHGRTLAIYTKDENDAVVQLAGKGVPFLDTAGNLNVDGTTTLKDNVTISPNKAINFEATDLSGAIVRHIVGKCATNDGWYIGAGGTSNSGILEIGTIDDGAETIQFVQRGAGNVEARKLVLLDGSGNTTIPGDLRLSTNKTVKINNGSTLVLEMGVGSNDVYIKNQRGTGVLQLTNDSNLTFRNSQVYYAMNGRGPGKSGTLLTNVENNRQAWQYVISAATAGTPRWVKVATIKHPGDASSQLDLMITGGIDSGHGRHYVDFITLSGRNLTSWSTSNLDNWVEWRRIGSPNKGNVPEYYVVKNDAATDADASFDFYAKVPRYGNGLYVTVLNTAGYNGQDSGKVIIYETGQDTGATGPSGSILVSMKQIFDSSAKPDFGDTTGTLPVNRGGTGATNVGDARNNLGLRTAAVRDVGESNGNVMEVGAYGLGGNGGKSIDDIVSNVDMMTRLKAYGGTFWRGVTKSGVSVQNGLYSHGSGIFMNAGDTMSAINIDYASAKVRVYAANNSGLAAGNVRYNELYGTANKPTKADVGLGNLTNDTQVKKAGDTMTGDLAAPNLHASGSGTASVYVNAGTGNAHVWFRTDGNERGVIWATPNTADLGQINIRAKTTGNTSAGDFSFRSDGRLDVPVAVKVGGAAMLTNDGNITSGSMFGGNLNNYLNTIKNDIVAGDNKQVSKTGDTMTGNLTINANLKVENPNGSMVDLGSENSDKYSRLTLARKVGSGAAVAMLKITPEGYVQFGYQDAVATTAPSKYLLVKSNGLEVEGDLVFNQTYRGTEEAVDITDKINDLNNMVIKGSDLGTRQLYKCVSSGGGSKIANKPTSDGNFVLEVLSLRKVSDTDWTCKQTFTTKGGSVEGTYVRYCQNGSWSAWKEVVAGVQPINLGGTGATSAAAARNNLGVGEWQSVAFGVLNVNGVSNADPTITFKNGAMVREAQGGSLGALILSASTTSPDGAKYIAFRPFGDSSGNEIRVKANGSSEPLLEWSYGPGIRSNSSGAFVIYAKTGQALHLRPNGDNSNQATVIDQNGKMTVGGEFEAQNSKITGNLNVSEDNRMIVLGRNTDIGLVKKSNMPGKMAISKSNSFTVMVSTNTNNQINPADTFNDIFKVDANGNQTVYGNSQVNRQLTVSSSATVNGVINANGGIIVPTAKYVQIADAPTQNNQATNKKYVDDKVASAISNAGDTYLPLAGGTVTGRLTITGDQLKTTSLWATGDAAVNGVLTVDGKARFNQEFSVSTSVSVQNTGNSHVFFRKADGTEKGLLWADDPGNVSIRAGGASGPVWNFWASGSCQFPGAISNYNGISSTTNYPGGKKNDYLNTAGLVTRFSNGAYASLYFQEYVENYHQAIINVNGFGRDDSFYFRAGGDFICTRNGSFDNVEIRSDRRAKSDIKVIENALEKVETLSGNTYELHNTSGGTTRSAGLIAQEVQEVLPEAVTQDIEADGGLLRLNYNSVIALLVESVKELSAEVKGLKAEIEELKSK
ncbi:L-shaped tail fiber protein [Klebsiella phage PKO111]|uniref:Long tail fiber protein Gp37 n=1 Tax=Klebsiella phage PKO111 TaxID=1654928 RepID=A0A162E4E0_9CAUD|nr:tail fiber protein [Klebsiella phage PKO111]AKJ73220.1 L-shaped tail fiber protein [Klebsiella phage PKO111]